MLLFLLEEKIMQFYRLTDDYIRYMKRLDYRVQDNYEGKKAYVGVVFNINLHNYFAPLSSYKPEQERIKIITVFKLRDRTDPTNKLGVIHLNNMIPALPKVLEEMDFKQEEPLYAQMLQKQYEYMTSKETQIKEQAFNLYDKAVNKKDSFFKKLCCDFVKLEQEYGKY